VFIRLALCSGAALIVYALMCFALRVRTIRVFANEVIRRRR